MRKFMFKLRNDKLKTMSKMNEKWKANKKATYYSEHVLSKYKQSKCPAGCNSEETTDHVLKCQLSRIERYKAIAEIQCMVKAATKVDPEMEKRKRSAQEKEGGSEEEFEMKSTEAIIDYWFEDYQEWQGKWAWMGYVKHDLATRFEAIKWNDGHNTISIIKKIQIIIMETVQEGWNDRCRLLHKAKIMSDEERKQRRENRKELLNNIITENNQNKNTQKEGSKSRKAFTSSLKDSPISEIIGEQVETSTQENITPAAAQRKDQQRKRQCTRYELQSIYADDTTPASPPDQPLDAPNDDGLLQPQWQLTQPGAKRSAPIDSEQHGDKRKAKQVTNAMGRLSESRASDSPLGTTSEDGGAAATRHLVTHVTAGPGATQQHTERQQQFAGVTSEAQRSTTPPEGQVPHVEGIEAPPRRDTSHRHRNTQSPHLETAAERTVKGRKRSSETHSQANINSDAPTRPSTRRRHSHTHTSEDSGRTG